MKIAILGTGVVGQTLSEKLVSLGHNVFMGTRDVEATMKKSEPDPMMNRPPLHEWLKKNGHLKLVEFRQAAREGEIIINATSGKGSIQALNMAGKENLEGKVLIDVCNSLDFSKGMPPTLLVCNNDSMGEQIQREFPGAKVVKTFNTMTASLMVNPSMVPGDHNVFVAGNDNHAKDQVKDLLQSFGWKKSNIIDLGDISTSRGTEMILPLWVRLMSNFQSPMFNFRIVKS